MKIAPRRVSDPPTIDRPRPIGFPSSSLSLVISIIVSFPGTISQVAGEEVSSAPAPGFRLGEATGFLTFGVGLAFVAADVVAAVGAVVVVAVGADVAGGVGLWVGEMPAGLGATGGFGGSLGLSGLEDAGCCCC